ncbi:multidrug resistance efflux pump [Clostridium tetanomorphum]|uniref:HlyD family secretion protein n=1 Tax=Clostridium tetanomorphum TaxID=1553 RepID=UPI00044B727D|nr:HlyD family efflux transporter periplasmic adaptor subunit [Clostridium tetanomorphum]KAJ49731.1 RND family efflux transporter MFP subunit [Clostridium tetanomorphum DSM 665]KAJ52650.1 RND family efflux transporter MFP subunit [Clostridium tetanomorphum DSM 665]MBP1863243.1 multidrug resistance efflux pump [Clostridium tetanomorphum]NRS84351.1 multidrug resistance efflux pump [Clostridium tetanomorphum]
MKELIKKKWNNNDTTISNCKEKRFHIKFNNKLIGVLILIIAVGVGFRIANSVLANEALKEDKYTVLKSGKNINKINVKGEVKSENTTNVYSNVTLTIKEVKVELGDKVKANDILAVLDTSKLQDQIKQLEATIVSADASNSIALDKAKAVYDSALALGSDEKNGDIKNAEVALKAAKLDFENKKRIYENNKELFNYGGVSRQDLKEYEISYENAKNTFDKCTVALNNIKTKVQLDLTTAKNNYDLARAKYKDNSQYITLENLKKDLNNAVIKSPVNGIISVKNASVGNLSSGVLFEIKDSNNITVNVNIKEVDIGKIKKGQKVEIRTDSTGTDIIQGEVISVQPIAKVDDKNLLNLNDGSNDKEAEFEAKIKINDKDHKLKIGMKAKVNIMLSEKKGVYTVPAESIINDKDNNDCLYIADKQGKDYIVKQIPITKGTETDLNVEILGQDLKDGIIVLNNPSDYEIGSRVKINGR